MEISRSASSREILIPSILLLVPANDIEAVFGGFGDRRCSPVAIECGIEHGAEPMKDDGMPNLRQHRCIDRCVIFGVTSDGGQGATRHQNDAAIDSFYRFTLLQVGISDVLQGDRMTRGQMIGARATGYQTAASIRRRCAALDQFKSQGPVQAHAALSRVHGFGNTEAERPEIFAVGNCRVPVDDGLS